MNHPAKFWDKTAEKYSKQPIADEAAYQKKLQVTQQYLKPNMEVLEFGWERELLRLFMHPMFNIFAQ